MYLRRSPQYGIIAVQALLALLISALATLALWRFNPVTLAVIAFLLLAVFFFFLLSLGRAWWIAQRPRPWLRPRGPGGRRGSGDGSGVREPRRPRSPYMPPMAEALDPDHLPTT